MYGCDQRFSNAFLSFGHDAGVYEKQVRALRRILALCFQSLNKRDLNDTLVDLSLKYSIIYAIKLNQLILKWRKATYHISFAPLYNTTKVFKGTKQLLSMTESAKLNWSRKHFSITKCCKLGLSCFSQVWSQTCDVTCPKESLIDRYDVTRSPKLRYLICGRAAQTAIFLD